MLVWPVGGQQLNGGGHYSHDRTRNPRGSKHRSTYKPIVMPTPVPPLLGAPTTVCLDHSGLNDSSV